MGGQRRYRVGMWDTAYRVTLELSDGGKALTLFGSDDFDKARAAFNDAKTGPEAGTVYLLQRSRVIDKHER